jgi:serine/threonine protein kinase
MRPEVLLVAVARCPLEYASAAPGQLHPDLAYAVGADRFLREIEVAANLTHPHILPLHDSGEVEGLLYYVMPYVEGESLRDRLRCSNRWRSSAGCSSRSTG